MSGYVSLFDYFFLVLHVHFRPMLCMYYVKTELGTDTLRPKKSRQDLLVYRDSECTGTLALPLRNFIIPRC